MKIPIILIKWKYEKSPVNKMSVLSRVAYTCLLRKGDRYLRLIFGIKTKLVRLAKYPLKICGNLRGLKKRLKSKLHKLKMYK